MGRAKRPTPCEQLKELLVQALDKEFGLFATEISIYPTQGYWKRQECDCVRWSAHAKVNGKNIQNLLLNINSYDRVKDCVRRGFTLTRCWNDRWHYDCSMKGDGDGKQIQKT